MSKEKDGWKRREFIAAAIKGAAFLSVASLPVISGCSDDGGGNPVNTGDPNAVITLDTNEAQYAALAGTGGTTALAANSLDNSGILVYRKSETEVQAFSRRCTHSGCVIGAFISGVSTCPCHGSTFALTGAPTSGPASAPLTKYTATISGTVITIKK